MGVTLIETGRKRTRDPHRCDERTAPAVDLYRPGVLDHLHAGIGIAKGKAPLL